MKNIVRLSKRSLTIGCAQDKTELRLFEEGARKTFYVRTGRTCSKLIKLNVPANRRKRKQPEV